ncbi:MAG: NnrS family protein [Dehalococcoidia bacterium]
MNTQAGTGRVQQQVPGAAHRETVQQDDQSAGAPGGSRYPVTPWSTRRFYRPYVQIALAVALTLGFTTGAFMLITPWFGIDRGVWWLTHAQAHGMAQIFGWAGLFTMGIAFHVLPRLRGGNIVFPWPQRITLVTVTTGIILRFLGQTIYSHPASDAALSASGILVAMGTVLFGATMFGALSQGKTRRSHLEPWLWAGSGWAIIAGLLHLGGILEMMSASGIVVPHSWNNAFITVAVLGFVINFIFGVSTRALAAFMSLRPCHVPVNRLAFWALNVGVACQAVAVLMQWDTLLIGTGVLLQAVGILAFIVSLRILERRNQQQRYLAGTYGRYEWFLRAAYCWLAAAGILMFLQGVGQVTGRPLLPVMVAGPILHMLTLGFITGVIFGMGARMLPLFEGSELPWRRSLDIAFAALNLSVATRVIFGFSGSPAMFDGLAVSGVVGLAALVSFAVPMYRAFRPGARDAYRRRAAAVGKRRLATIQAINEQP